MLVGIMSDTHGHAEAMALAVRLLQQRGATCFLHCGDVGSTGVIDVLAGLNSAFVWGNCDHDRLSLSRYGERLNVRCLGPFGELALDGKTAALLHGDDHRLRQRLLDEQRFDYLFEGHTHARHDRRFGRTRLVNPGALHRAREKTVALLDTATDALEFLSLPI